jgi:DNA polymerase
MGETKHLPVNCSTKECEHFKKCCQLPSSCYFNKEGKIDVMIVGQGAGWQEERDKKPWVGKAGELLRNILRDIKQDHMWDYGICLTNTVRCRPTELNDGKLSDRAPTVIELAHCMPNLYRDIHELKPKVILLMGGSSASSFGFDGTITSLRGKEQVMDFRETKYPIMITFHPAGVLRQPGLGKDMRKDIEKAFNLSKS